MQELEEKTGLILHMQRLSTEDGPGIRTTVFMKGCPLRCGWCHNPESLSPKAQVHWLENRCIGCETCVEACPNGCISMTPEGAVIDRDRCQGCGTCAEACPANAMERLGTAFTVPELVHELVKDQTFYATSGGGVTISGGEPTMQPHFVAAVLQRLKELEIATAIDTCGFCSKQCLERVLPFADLILFDLKEIDSAKHQAFTGQMNDRILENLILIRDHIANSSKGLWIRTPLIPGATATAENITGIGRFLARHLEGVVERWELCAFNNLCRDKYRRLDMTWQYQDAPLLTAQELQEWEGIAKGSGFDPETIIATGATRGEYGVT